MLRAVPGVKSASWISQMPMSTSGSSSSVRANPKQPRESATPGIYYMAPGTLHTLGLNLIEGRDLIEGDMVEFDPDNDRWADKLRATAISPSSRRSSTMAIRVGLAKAWKMPALNSRS